MLPKSCAYYQRVVSIGMDGAVLGLGGAMAPPKFFFLNIIILIGTNFSNFVQ